MNTLEFVETKDIADEAKVLMEKGKPIPVGERTDRIAVIVSEHSRMNEIM